MRYTMVTSNCNIALQNLSIGYRLRHSTKTVANDICASIRAGELTCLLGPNGVGKSTLLRTLAAFQPKLAGTVTYCVDGKEAEVESLSDKQLSRLIGVVLTEKPDVRNMTVRELVALGRSPYTGFWGMLSQDDHEIVDESIRLVGAEALCHRRVDTLSDGERQKIMVAKALAQQTPIIFLDEPTAFLDYPSKVEMLQLLLRLAHSMNKTIFLSTHDLELALQVADSVWLMERESLSIGSPKELAERGLLSRFVERDGISFNPQTFAISIRKE